MISSEGKLLKSWELYIPATGVATYGDRAYVTCSEASGELHCVSLEGEMKTLFTTKVGMGACAPVVSHDGKKVYICNRYKATVSEVDATSGELLHEVKVLREPCAASLSKSGRFQRSRDGCHALARVSKSRDMDHLEGERSQFGRPPRVDIRSGKVS